MVDGLVASRGDNSLKEQPMIRNLFQVQVLAVTLAEYEHGKSDKETI